jgi:hypothetical protein
MEDAMTRTLGWALAGLIAVDQFLWHGTYTAVATQLLQRILVHV